MPKIYEYAVIAALSVLTYAPYAIMAWRLVGPIAEHILGY